MTGEVKKIKVKDNLELNCHLRETGSQIWLIATHGVGEHSGRHEYLLKLFSQYFNICLYDLRGHGDSEGAKGNIDSFEDYYDDLDDVLIYLRSKYSLKRYYLFGHSMGALITAGFIQNRLTNKEKPGKVFLSAPPVCAPGPHGMLFHYAPLNFSKTLANLPFSFPVKGLVPLKYLSHDKRVIQNYMNDPKVLLKLHTRLLLQLVAEARNVFSRPLRCEGELYVSYGSEDKVVNANCIHEYFTQIEKKANLYKVEGGYHELHNEIDKYKSLYFNFLKKSFLSSDQLF